MRSGPWARRSVLRGVSDVAVTGVVTPSGVDELVAALAEATPQTRLLAGGTDLVCAIRRPAPGRT